MFKAYCLSQLNRINKRTFLYIYNKMKSLLKYTSSITSIYSLSLIKLTFSIYFSLYEVIKYDFLLKSTMFTMISTILIKKDNNSFKINGNFYLLISLVVLTASPYFLVDALYILLSDKIILKKLISKLCFFVLLIHLYYSYVSEWINVLELISKVQLLIVIDSLLSIEVLDYSINNVCYLSSSNSFKKVDYIEEGHLINALSRLSSGLIVYSNKSNKIVFINEIAKRKFQNSNKSENYTSLEKYFKYENFKMNKEINLMLYLSSFKQEREEVKLEKFISEDNDTLLVRTENIKSSLNSDDEILMKVAFIDFSCSKDGFNEMRKNIFEVMKFKLLVVIIIVKISYCRGDALIHFLFKYFIVLIKYRKVFINRFFYNFKSIVYL